MPKDYGSGQEQGDWTSDTVPHGATHKCTECGDAIAPDVWFFSQGQRLLCGDCIVMVLNAREDHIRDLEANARRGTAVRTRPLLGSDPRPEIVAMGVDTQAAYV